MKYSFLLFVFLIISCSNTVNYTPEFKAKTEGIYLYSLDETIEVSYNEKNEISVLWRGVDVRPIAIDQNTFTSVEMNKKLRFIKHPETNTMYLTDVTEDDNRMAYDYKKMPENFNVPSVHLKNKNYTEALKGYLAIQKEDSTSVYINEYHFNKYGYKLMRDENYKDAIEVLKINAALYPESDNVYDSLGDAYLKIGDSLNAFNNFKKSLEFNNGNKRAKRFVEAYNKA